MNAAIKHLLSAFILLGIMTLALYLRFHGIDWSFKEPGSYSSHHPDENHYQYCADALHFKWLTEDELQLPWDEQWRLFYQRNLHIPNPASSGPGTTGLRPVNYNYGTMPLHMYLLYRHYLVKNVIHQTDASQSYEWVFFGVFDIFSYVIMGFIALMALLFYRSVLKSFNQAEPNAPPLWKNEKKIALFLPSILIPFTGLAIFFFLPTEVANLERYNPASISIVIIGRIVTAFLGVLTVLLVYFIGRDAYNRATGLVAAMMLATAMLHVQTSHFATVDGIAAFWTTAAVYFFFKISQKSRLLWYLLGAVCTGFAIGTKWSAIILPAMLWFAHAIATWSDERQGKDGRLIHSFWLVVSALFMVHFYSAAKSADPLFHITLGHFRDFYVSNWILISILTGVIVFATIIYLLMRKLRNEQHDFFVGCFQIYLPWLRLAIAIPVGFAAFMFAQPMAYFDAQAFASDITNVSRINATGESEVVYTKQFNHTLPVITLLDNLFYPSLDYITAFFVIAGCIFAAFRLLSVKCKSDLFLAAWAIPAFVVYSSLDSKFPRYIVPVLPVMIVLGARLIVELCRINIQEKSALLPWASAGVKKFAKGFGYAGGLAAILFGGIYGFAYSQMYNQPHTLHTAGQYIKQYGKPNAKVTQNNWDEGLNGIHIEERDRMAVHAADDRNPTQRINYFIEQLQKNDYIVFPSKRGYGTTLHNPEEYPITNQFLRAFFAEQLGYRIAKVVENPVQFMGLHFYVDEEDETARIYDHPKVIIFEKIKDLSAGQIHELITNPPDWIHRITEKEILTLRDGRPVFAPVSNAPVFRWWVMLSVLGLLAFLILFPVTKHLPDGGFAVSKTIGLAFFSWLCWYLASTQILLLSNASMWFVLFVMIGFACIAWQKWGDEWLLFIKTKWRFLVGIEMLFIVVWAIFLLIRMYHPGIIWGEKPMNFSFVNAAYRAVTFPPEDPWISGHPVNYYYYGHAVFSIAGKFAGILPEYLFNVAGTSIGALAAISIFTIAFAICRCYIMSLIATYLAVFAGHIISCIQICAHAINQTIPIPWKEWNPGISLWEVLTGWKYAFYWVGTNAGYYVGMYEVKTPIQMKEQLFTWWEWMNTGALAVYQALILMYYAVMFYLGFATEAMQRELSRLNYEHLMWKAGHDIYPGTAANEFPNWMHLFMDFHAHMLVIPFTWAFITILLALFLTSSKEIKTFALSGYAFVLALLLGTVICTNTWDMPALVIVLITAVMVKWYRESDNAWLTFKRAEWLDSNTLQSWARFPFGILVLVFVLQLVMFFPFHANFAARVGGVGVMTEGHSPLITFLGFWAPMIFPLVIAGVLAAVVRSTDYKISILRFVGFTILFVSVLGASIWFTNHIHNVHDMLKSITSQTTLEQREAIQAAQTISIPGLGNVQFPPTLAANDLPFDLTVFGLLFPFLVVLFLQLWNKRLSANQVFGFLIGFIGLGLMLGIEWFYIQEGWSRPSHRYNTLFKFNIQIWHYLSVFAVFAFIYASYKLTAMRSTLGWFLSTASRGIFSIVFVILVVFTVPFTIIAPYLVTQTHGALTRDVRDAKLPTLNGLAWLQHNRYDAYAGVKWLNRYVSGDPNIVEFVDHQKGYSDIGRFSTNTGLPALLGWEHHVGERMHLGEKEPRRNAVYRIYESNNKEEVIDLLAKYKIEYLVFGDIEMNQRRGFQNRKEPLGSESLNRFEKWGDTFKLIYRLGDQSIFQIDRSQNRIYGLSSDESYMDIPSVEATLSNVTSLHPSAEGLGLFEGEAGEANGYFNEPRGLAQDANGYIYAADTRNHRIQAFREDGSFEGKTGTEGNGRGQFKEPNDIAVNLQNGDLYITDTWNHRIVKMDNKGNVLGMFAGSFFGPRGVIFHPQTELLYVCDTGSHLIRVMNPQGQVIANVGKNGGGTTDDAFREPVGIAYFPISGDIVVVDSLNKRLKVYSMAGELKSIIPIQSTWNGEGGFEGHVACTHQDVIYMTDPREKSVHAYTPDGQLVGKITTDKLGRPFNEPIGIMVSHNGKVLVSDKGANRITEVQPFVSLDPMIPEDEVEVEPAPVPKPTPIPTVEPAVPADEHVSDLTDEIDASDNALPSSESIDSSTLDVNMTPATETPVDVPQPQSKNQTDTTELIPPDSHSIQSATPTIDSATTLMEVEIQPLESEVQENEIEQAAGEETIENGTES